MHIPEPLLAPPKKSVHWARTSKQRRRSKSRRHCADQRKWPAFAHGNRGPRTVKRPSPAKRGPIVDYLGCPQWADAISATDVRRTHAVETLVSTVHKCNLGVSTADTASTHPPKPTPTHRHNTYTHTTCNRPDMTMRCLQHTLNTTVSSLTVYLGSRRRSVSGIGSCRGCRLHTRRIAGQCSSRGKTGTCRQ